MREDRVTIRVSESIEIARPREAVWDYTQDYSRRADWDVGVRNAQLIGEEPRRAHLELAGLGPVTAEYRLYRRPERTSLAFTEVRSRWVVGGGGSWDYQTVPAGTRWTQTNTLVLRPGVRSRLLAPLVRARLAASTRRSLRRAKRLLESLESG
ncbi:MAG TPA: SRPBCC family protein [Candidatus Limnocylindrales bacterium]|nr:SRPBCC family protein [Candidatus Limnocylindrales bacterium]